MKNEIMKKIEKVSPVLLFAEEKKRTEGYVSQAVALSGAGASAALLAMASFHFFFGILAFFAFFTFVIGGILFITDYAVNMMDEKTALRNNLREAAKDSLDKSKETLDLSKYISNKKGKYDVEWNERVANSRKAVRRVDKEYIASLSPRHIAWIKKEYKRQLNAEAYERTEAKQIYKETLSSNLTALDGDVDMKKLSQYMSHHLGALEDLRSGNKARTLTAMEKFDKEMEEAS